MENADALSGGALAAGDKAIPPPRVGLKREQDSMDDFEHLEGEAPGPRLEEFAEAPFHDRKVATQSFLDTEREEMFMRPVRVEAPAPAAFVEPPVGALVDKVGDHVADKFTDSESEAGESPLHRPEPARSDRAPSPLVATDPTPVLAPSPAPEPPEPISGAPTETKSSEPEPVLPKLEPVPPKPEPVVAPKTEFEIPKAKLSAEPITPAPAPAPTAIPEVAPKPAAPSKPEPAAPVPARAPTAHVIEAEVIFCQMGLDAWFDPQRLHPKVESLMYWREPAKSGAALGAGLALLVALACCSVVSVLAYGALLLLVAAVAFRVYRNVLQAVQKTNDGHPFKWLLERDISVGAERAQEAAAAATAHLNAVTAELRRLFLVEDLVDSLKFGVLLWCLTYVGACFNGITLIILGWIALFTLPKAYELNKAQVDANLELARAKINEISAKVRAAVPLGRKAESDKDK